MFFATCRRSWREPAATRRGVAAALDATVVPESRSGARTTCTAWSTGSSTRQSFFELKPLLRAELVIGFGRHRRRGRSASSRTTRCIGGVLFVDSADKAARFIWLCDAFNVPLLFLADVPGFMIGRRWSGRASSATARR